MNCVCNTLRQSRPVSGVDCARLPGTSYSVYVSSVRFFSYWAFYFYSRFSQREDAGCAIAG